MVLKGTKWNSCCLIRRDEYCKNKPEGGGRVWFRRRRKARFVMRAIQCLDTDLNRISDVIGRCKRIWVRRSSSPATVSADDELYFVMGSNIIVFVSNYIYDTTICT